MSSPQAAKVEINHALKQFMDDNDIDEDNFKGHTTRHIRINPRRPIALALIAAQLGHAPTPVSWLPDIYALPAAVPLASSAVYKSGNIYGIDVASAAAVTFLGPQRGDRILDLCCAPGAKLSLIADIVCPPTSCHDSSASAFAATTAASETGTGGAGFVVGVDVSESRLSATRSLLRKYAQCNVRLYLGDGTRLQIPCPTPTTPALARQEKISLARWREEEMGGGSGGRGRKSRKKKAKCPSSTAPVTVNDGEGDVSGREAAAVEREGEGEEDTSDKNSKTGRQGHRPESCATSFPGEEGEAQGGETMPQEAEKGSGRTRGIQIEETGIRNILKNGDGGGTRFFFETSEVVGAWSWLNRFGSTLVPLI